MKEKRRYSTKQKAIVMDFFYNHKQECFTAKDIILNDALHLGEATVYRLLSKLSNEGELKKFTGDKSNGATYQYNDGKRCNSHFHLKCLKCGELVHMNCSAMVNVGQHIEENHDFIVDNSKTIIYGFCKNCK